MKYLTITLFAMSITTAAIAVGVPLLLLELIGQTCRGNTGEFDVVYTIDREDDQWVVHELFGLKGTAETAMKDVGWHPATVEGAVVLTFQGMAAMTTLRMSDIHTVQGHFSQSNAARPGVSDYTLSCTPAPADKRWRTGH